MTLDLLTNRAKQAQKESSLPKWVSSKNITLDAYNHIIQLKIERLAYISVHNQPKDYLAKHHYQITASEVARHLNVATTTLISSSSYSKQLKDYLDKVNQSLRDERDKKLNTHKRTLDAGPKQRKKDEIFSNLQDSKKQLSELQKRNAKEQVEHVLRALPLPIKRKLGLNV